MDGFQEIRNLGRGAFGEVNLCKRKSDGLLCAVKRIQRTDMTDGEVKQHMTEVRALQTLSHPFIMRYFESIEDDRCLHIVTEYADCGDLQQLLKRQIDLDRFFEPAILTAVMAQMITAVAHVHAHRVMHRDLKPANVFLTKKGVIKLGDFGVAKVLAGTTVCEQMTCVGSPTYMAPEVVGGEIYGPPCDVWSLGVMFYEFCTFQKPFQGRSLGELVLRISAGKYDGMSKHLVGTCLEAFSQTFTTLISKMLVVDVKCRISMSQALVDPAVTLFVVSVQSCAAVLQLAFKQNGTPTEHGDPDGPLTPEEVQTLSKLPKASAPQKSLSPTPKPRSAAGGGKAAAEILALSREKLEKGCTFELSQTSVLGDLGDLSDTQISFNLTATGRDVQGHGKPKDANSTDMGSLQKTLALPNQGTIKRGAMQNSYDAADMRAMLGDAIEDESSGDRLRASNAATMKSTLSEASTTPEEEMTLLSPNSAALRQSSTRKSFTQGEETLLSPQSHRSAAPPSSASSMQSAYGKLGRVPSPAASQEDRRRSSPLVPTRQSSGQAKTQAASKSESKAKWEILLTPAQYKCVDKPGTQSKETGKTAPSGSGVVHHHHHHYYPKSNSGRATPSASTPRKDPKDLEKSSTWHSEAALPPAEQRRNQATLRRFGATTPPAGRPSTPEVERARRAARNQERDSERHGALVIPFFDGKAPKAPPQSFLDSIEQHDHRQKSRSLQRGDSVHADGVNKAATPPHGKVLSTSNSGPTLRAPSNGPPNLLMKPVKQAGAMAGPTGQVRVRHR
eukprot:TRINITY_DN36424_c0_g1_i1.p1 TRINITY_DN36424_c0_g1~~TRINITY_DN36424_c0_g1_i1.p1  ORF type:complete len:788 (+),score=136.74 TRINITY_DN36424_c0_g1_i1:94-2457(+)